MGQLTNTEQQGPASRKRTGKNMLPLIDIIKAFVGIKISSQTSCRTVASGTTTRSDLSL